MAATNVGAIMPDFVRFELPKLSSGEDMTDDQWAELEPFVVRLRAAEKASQDYDFGTIRLGGLVSERERLAIASRSAWHERQVAEARAALLGKRIEVLGD